MFIEKKLKNLFKMKLHNLCDCTKNNKIYSFQVAEDKIRM